MMNKSTERSLTSNHEGEDRKGGDTPKTKKSFVIKSSRFGKPSLPSPQPEKKVPEGEVLRRSNSTQPQRKELSAQNTPKNTVSVKKTDGKTNIFKLPEVQKPSFGSLAASLQPSDTPLLGKPPLKPKDKEPGQQDKQMEGYVNHYLIDSHLMPQPRQRRAASGGDEILGVEQKKSEAVKALPVVVKQKRYSLRKSSKEMDDKEPGTSPYEVAT